MKIWLLYFLYFDSGRAGGDSGRGGGDSGRAGGDSGRRGGAGSGPGGGGAQGNPEKPHGPNKKKDCEVLGSSVIGCLDQTLGEAVAVTGTPYSLNYRSDRTPGHLDSYTFQIPISGESVPVSLLRIDLEVSIAGQEFIQSFPPDPNQSYSFTWDGLDAYGRQSQGLQRVSVKTGYVYEAIYYNPGYGIELAFGIPSSELLPIGDARLEAILWQEWEDSLGTLDTKNSLGLGGWTLDVQHTYDPAGKTLYYGDGSKQGSGFLGRVIETIAGTGTPGYGTDSDVPAIELDMSGANDVVAAPDGSFYVLHRDNVLSRITPDGIIFKVAGGVSGGVGIGDGKVATSANLNAAKGIALGPDGSIYIADAGNRRIRRITPDGIINSVVGSGTGSGYSGDGGLATEAVITYPQDVAIGADGSIYFTDNNEIYHYGGGCVRQVTPGGIIDTIWCGSPPAGYPTGYADSIEIGADGSLYIGIGPYLNRVASIVKVTPDGNERVIVGGASTGYSGDDAPAVDALIDANKFSVASDGYIYIADYFNSRIRRISPDGFISTIVGKDAPGFSGDGGLAINAALNRPESIAIHANGALTIADNGNYRIRRVTETFKGLSLDGHLIPSVSGNEAYLFDPSGQHLQTINAWTGAVIYDFNYDTNGLLTGVVDGDGNTTTIERDTAGNATAIIAPGGQHTSLTLNFDGYLSTMINPAGEITSIDYAAGGLMASFTKPEGNTSQYTYDSLGLLTRADDAAGGFKELSRTENDTGYTVISTTAMDKVTTYQMEFLPTGEIRSTVTYPSGAQNIVLADAGGSNTVTYPNGSVAVTKHGPDPRFGMLSPVLESFSLTTPDGLIINSTMSRTVTLSDPDNLLSLETQEDTLTVNGNTTTYAYDAATRTLTVTSPEGRQKVTTTDEFGRVIRVDLAEDMPGTVDPVVKNYDAQGLITHVSQGSQSWSYVFDTLNRVLFRNDAAGNTTSYDYDNADRTVAVDLPSGRSVGYAYDQNSNRTQVVMPSLDIHNKTHTVRDLLAGYQPPDNPAGTTNAYNLDKALTSKTLASGRIETNSFDLAGLWTGTSYPEATVTYNFTDSSGRLSGLTWNPEDGGTAQTIDFSYDASLTIAMTWTGVAAGVFTYTYDNNFLLTEATLTSGLDSLVTTLTHDADGMVTSYGPFTLTRGAPGGALSLIEDDSLTMAIAYDSLMNLQSRSHTVDSLAIYDFVLTRDVVGNIVSKDETVNDVLSAYVYSYDDDGRLTEVTKNGVSVESYSYDINGNRLAAGAGASYDSQDRLINHDGVAYTFDDDGYLAQRGSDTFQYSTRGELLSATVGAETIRYTYDGFGRRVGRTDSTGTTQYLYGVPGNLYLVTAVRDPGGVLSNYYYDETGVLYALERDGSMYYVAADQIGTPLVVTDSAGVVVKRLEYNSFGIRLSDSAPLFALPIGFAGGIDDRTTGLVRFGYRDYDPTSGRWMARDPVLYSGGQANLYVYVGNDPVGMKDPLGLWCFSASAYLGGGIGGELCCSGGRCSNCIEGGVGTGAGFGIGEGKAKESGNYAVGEAAIECGPISAGPKCTFDHKCKLQCSPFASVGPVSLDSGGIGYDPTWELTSAKIKCKPQAKLALVGCVNHGDLP